MKSRGRFVDRFAVYRSALVLGILALAASVQADVVINVVKGTSALAGHSLYTLTAVSDNPNEPIWGFDFGGDPYNNDPATGFGFFGPMSQVNPIAPFITTVFQDYNALFALVDPPRQVNEDSQFLFNSSSIFVVADGSQEGPDILQAIFAFDEPRGFSVPFVQIVVPDGGQISYRGDVIVSQLGQGVSKRVEGTRSDPPPFDPPPLVANIFDHTNFRGDDIINLQPVDSAPGTPPVTWSELAGPIYTPGFGALPDAPGLGSATWTWNPATQAFQFKTLGASAGTYVWQGLASNAVGSDPYSISVDVYVPEPTTAVLVGLVCFAFSVVRIPRNEAPGSAGNSELQRAAFLSANELKAIYSDPSLPRN